MDKPTAIEKSVLSSLDRVGWEPELWFPRVLREHLNLADGPTDDELHEVLLALIRKGYVTVSDPDVRGVSVETLPHLTLDLDADARRRLNLARERSRKPPRGHFEIFAHGADFDPDQYLSTSTLQFDRVWRRAAPDTSGIGKLLGDGASIPLPEQERIAVEFLASNRDALRELAGAPGIETFILGLQYNLELHESTRGVALGLSQKLLWHALDVGIKPMFYVMLRHPGEEPGYEYSHEEFLASW